MKTVVLLAGTGYYETQFYPIGGAFRRASEDTPVTVERTFRNYHGMTAEGRFVRTGTKVAFPLGQTREVQS